MRRRNTLIALLLVSVVLLLGFADKMRSSAEEHGSTTVYSESARGFHIFYQWADTVAPGLVQIERKIFDPQSLQADQILFILSPTRDLTKFEVEDVRDFVSRGGILFLSFDDAKEFGNFRGLLGKLGIEAHPLIDKQFVNGQVIEASPTADSRFFKKSEQYAFYSAEQLNTSACQNRNFSCYVLDQPVGRGHVVLVAGLTPMSNAMLGRLDNRQVAFRLLGQQRGLRFDEYHHFYSDHSFWQLLKVPSFGLPFGAMLLCVFLYFLFGRGPGQTLAAPKREVPGYHQLNQSILQGVISTPAAEQSALLLHQSFLEKSYPLAKDAIRESLARLPNAWDPAQRRVHLIQLHRDLLLQKRSLKKVA